MGLCAKAVIFIGQFFPDSNAADFDESAAFVFQKDSEKNSDFSKIKFWTKQGAFEILLEFGSASSS
jgi:hypothetical protein